MCISVLVIRKLDIRWGNTGLFPWEEGSNEEILGKEQKEEALWQYVGKRHEAFYDYLGWSNGKCWIHAGSLLRLKIRVQGEYLMCFVSAKITELGGDWNVSRVTPHEFDIKFLMLQAITGTINTWPSG